MSLFCFWFFFFFSYFFYGKDSVNPFFSDYGLEMMLAAVDAKTGLPMFSSQKFKKYSIYNISEVIKNDEDNQDDSEIE